MQVLNSPSFHLHVIYLMHKITKFGFLVPALLHYVHVVDIATATEEEDDQRTPEKEMNNNDADDDDDRFLLAQSKNELIVQWRGVRRLSVRLTVCL